MHNIAQCVAQFEYILINNVIYIYIYDTGIPLGSQMHEIFFLRFYYDFDTVGRYEFDRLSIWGYDFVTILLRFRYGSGYGLDTILIRFRYDFGTNLIWFWDFV